MGIEDKKIPRFDEKNIAWGSENSEEFEGTGDVMRALYNAILETGDDTVIIARYDDNDIIISPLV